MYLLSHDFKNDALDLNFFNSINFIIIINLYHNNNIKKFFNFF